MLLDTGIYAVAFGFKFEAIFVFIFGFIGKNLTHICAFLPIYIKFATIWMYLSKKLTKYYSILSSLTLKSILFTLHSSLNSQDSIPTENL